MLTQRRLENLLQAMADPSKLRRCRMVSLNNQLAAALFSDWDSLITATRAHMANVHNVFEKRADRGWWRGHVAIASHFSELWDMAHKPDVIEHVLEHDIAIANPPEAAKTIIQFKADIAKKTMVAWAWSSQSTDAESLSGPVHS